MSDPVKKSRGIKTIAIINRQVRADAKVCGNFLLKIKYIGLKILVSRKESTRIDQNGHRILPKKKIAIAKTNKKYLSRIGLGGIDDSVPAWKDWLIAVLYVLTPEGEKICSVNEFMEVGCCKLGEVIKFCYHAQSLDETISLMQY